MLDICTLLGYGAILACIAFIVLCVFVLQTTNPFPVVFRSEKEKLFYDPKTDKTNKFPSLDDPWSVHLSVVVPAYEEEVRLPPMLDECLEYLTSRESSLKYEVVVVSDGSKDNTAKVAKEYVKKHGAEIVRVLELEQNRGKGGAIRIGIQSCRGAVILFADADGATKFPDLEKLESSLKDLIKEAASACLGIVCGSRAHLEEQAISSRSYFRTLLMHGFHFLVWFFTVRNIRDTQCGFKLLTRETMVNIFIFLINPSLNFFLYFQIIIINIFIIFFCRAFDVELLYIAQKLKIPVSEVAVNWTEIEGSKLVPVWSWLQMGRDLFLIWLRYLIGAWKLNTKSA
ncbi:hypothetical protein L9F63_016268 [Diploptera punctata]|uniref:Dolichyl-phosphate beta-glucosyltransferase n=1 Tax=Diploptera punctata TaxID=6984 RepID=A0AAD8A1P3_DIPPU|nr:hypothetical protein L9F63_016268 [Diploptera punctata]